MNKGGDGSLGKPKPVYVAIVGENSFTCFAFNYHLNIMGTSA